MSFLNIELYLHLQRYKNILEYIKIGKIFSGMHYKHQNN